MALSKKFEDHVEKSVPLPSQGSQFNLIINDLENRRDRRTLEILEIERNLKRLEHDMSKFRKKTFGSALSDCRRQHSLVRKVSDGGDPYGGPTKRVRYDTQRLGMRRLSGGGGDGPPKRARRDMPDYYDSDFARHDIPNNYDSDFDIDKRARHDARHDILNNSDSDFPNYSDSDFIDKRARHDIPNNFDSDYN